MSENDVILSVTYRADSKYRDEEVRFSPDNHRDPWQAARDFFDVLLDNRGSEIRTHRIRYESNYCALCGLALPGANQSCRECKR